MKIRKMTEADLAAVHEIEKSIFSMPWSEKSFCEACSRSENIYLVAEENGEILGYAGMWQAADEGEITNVAVKETARRRGIAQALLEQLLQEGVQSGTNVFFLEVRESNTAARKLYEKLGFLQAGIRKNFYERPVEHAVVMSRTLC
jgi:ribosomal-protein-alanine N-acetyltransferase